MNLIALVEDIEQNRLFEGHLASQNIKKMNDILYEILEPDLLRNDGRVFSFLDVFEASLPHAAWCTYGVHMKPVWYENVMTNVLGDILQ